MSAAPILDILRDGEPVKSQAVEGEVLLGRGEGCVIRLDDRAVSREHAVFKQASDGVQVEKKSEFAPLKVNGVECTSAVLKVGDVVAIGPYLVRLASGGGGSAASIAAEAGGPVAPVIALTGGTTAPAGSVTAPPETELPPLDMAGGGAPAPSIGQAAPGPEPLPMEFDAVRPSSQSAAQADAAMPGLELGSPMPEMGNAAQESSDMPALEIPAASPALGADEPVELAGEDDKTKAASDTQVAVKLIFKPGTANVVEYEVTKDEISIGRGKDCDIVIEDKKASRRNTLIRRAGLSFVVKDLQSSNGTYLNGQKVDEHELSGDDKLRIGNVEFEFKVTSAAYESQKAQFDMPMPSLEDPMQMQGTPPMGASGAAAGGSQDIGQAIEAMQLGAPMPESAPPQVAPTGNTFGGGIPGASGFAGAQTNPGFAMPAAGGMPGISGIPGMPGIGGAQKGGKQSLIERFRSLPPRRQLIWGLAFLAAFYFLFLDDDEQATKAPEKKPVASASAVPGGKPTATFESLTPDQKKFVETQHDLAFDLYRQKDYDRALFEVRKIFTLIPDYKDSREIETYALEGKRKMEAIEQEKHRKEEEARIKAQVAQLIEEARGHMDRKEYDQAQANFSDILTLDPDNADVAGWKKVIEDYEQKMQLTRQQKQVQEEINQRGWDLYKQASALRKQRHYHGAIKTFQEAVDIGASDPRLIRLAKLGVVRCRRMIAALRDPLLKNAAAAEGAGDFAKAFALYEKALVIDPPSREARAGIERIRGVLHDRAKQLYTEAVIAESYSDFATAKQKYKDCLSTAPRDDIYHDRAQRKLANYFKIGGSDDSAGIPQ